MIFLGMGIGVILGVLFTTWAQGITPSEPRPHE